MSAHSIYYEAEEGFCNSENHKEPIFYTDHQSGYKSPNSHYLTLKADFNDKRVEERDKIGNVSGSPRNDNSTPLSDGFHEDANLYQVAPSKHVAGSNEKLRGAPGICSDREVKLEQGNYNDAFFYTKDQTSMVEYHQDVYEPKSVCAPSNITEAKMAAKDSVDSSTCVGSFDDSKYKEQYLSGSSDDFATITNADYSAKNSTKKLFILRKQLTLKSNLRSFKILAIVTLVFALCPIISVFLELSCISTGVICLPKFEIQTTGVLEKQGMGLFNSFRMQKIVSHNSFTDKSKESSLALFENLIYDISAHVLDSGFKQDSIKETVQDLFGTSNEYEKTIIKLSRLGYSKAIYKDGKIGHIYHSYFGYGIDLPGVLVKDVTFSLSLKESQDDSEYMSDMFAARYRQLFGSVHGNTNLSNYASYASYAWFSSKFSQLVTYTALVTSGIDLFIMLLLFSLFFILKNRINNGLSMFENNSFELDFKSQYYENQKDDFICSIWLITTIFLWFNIAIRIVNIVCEITYVLQLEKSLIFLNLDLICGIKLIACGTIIEILNISIHVIVGLCLATTLFIKPWVIKIII